MAGDRYNFEDSVRGVGDSARGLTDRFSGLSGAVDNNTKLTELAARKKVIADRRAAKEEARNIKKRTRDLQDFDREVVSGTELFHRMSTGLTAFSVALSAFSKGDMNLSAFSKGDMKQTLYDMKKSLAMAPEEMANFIGETRELSKKIFEIQPEAVKGVYGQADIMQALSKLDKSVLGLVMGSEKSTLAITQMESLGLATNEDINRFVVNAKNLSTFNGKLDMDKFANILNIQARMFGTSKGMLGEQGYERISGNLTGVVSALTDNFKALQKINPNIDYTKSASQISSVVTGLAKFSPEVSKAVSESMQYALTGNIEQYNESLMAKRGVDMEQFRRDLAAGTAGDVVNNTMLGLRKTLAGRDTIEEAFTGTLANIVPESMKNEQFLSEFKNYQEVQFNPIVDEFTKENSSYFVNLQKATSTSIERAFTKLGFDFPLLGDTLSGIRQTLAAWDLGFGFEKIMALLQVVIATKMVGDIPIVGNILRKLPVVGGWWGKGKGKAADLAKGASKYEDFVDGLRSGAVKSPVSPGVVTRGAGSAREVEKLAMKAAKLNNAAKVSKFARFLSNTGRALPIFGKVLGPVGVALSAISGAQQYGGISGAVGGLLGGGKGGFGNALMMGAGGAMTGAAIGSVIPIVGTAAGAIVGGIVGVLGGAIGGDKISNAVKPFFDNLYLGAKDLASYIGGKLGDLVNWFDKDVGDILNFYSSGKSDSNVGKGIGDWYNNVIGGALGENTQFEKESRYKIIMQQAGKYGIKSLSDALNTGYITSEQFNAATRDKQIDVTTGKSLEKYISDYRASRGDSNLVYSSGELQVARALGIKTNEYRGFNEAFYKFDPNSTDRSKNRFYWKGKYYNPEDVKGMANEGVAAVGSTDMANIGFTGFVTPIVKSKATASDERKDSSKVELQNSVDNLAKATTDISTIVDTSKVGNVGSTVSDLGAISVVSTSVDKMNSDTTVRLDRLVDGIEGLKRSIENSVLPRLRPAQ